MLDTDNTRMDPIATSFLVFFALTLGGFILLVFLGCVMHCCCTVDMPTYRPEFTDEAIICERLTKKERMAVIEKMFENYDIRLTNNDDIEANIVEDTKIVRGQKHNTLKSSPPSLQEEKKICAICLEEAIPTPSNTNIHLRLSPRPPCFDDEINYHNSLTLTSSDDSSYQDQQEQNNKKHKNKTPSSLSSVTERPSSSSSYLQRKPSAGHDTKIDKNQIILQGHRCKHVYHRGCIKPWLEQGKVSCPCCRKDIMNPDDFRCAVVGILRKERLQVMKRWGIRENWVQLDENSLSIGQRG